MITSTLDIAERLNFWFVEQALELPRNLPSNKVANVSLQRTKDLRKDDSKAHCPIYHTRKY